MNRRKIKILHVGLSNNIGGIEIFLKNLSCYVDSSEFIFDYIALSKDSVLVDYFIDKKLKVHYLPSIKKAKEYICKFIEILNENNYDIVHFHKNSAANILLYILAKTKKVKTIIHSHNTSSNYGKFTNLIHHINKKIFIRYADLKISCGEKAAVWMFGEKGLKRNEVYIINNGINYKEYEYNECTRNKMRKILKLDDKLVYGHVGRFEKQKNNNSVLLLIGEGSLKNNIENKVKCLNLSDSVYFLGKIENIADYLNAFDVFLLPSLYEGLSISSIEAQVNNLPVIASNTIDKTSDISNNIIFLPLDMSANEWAKKSLIVERNYITGEVNKSYDINSSFKKLIDLYRGICKNK